MRGKQVYLAGPITGCTYEECTDWREDYERSLQEFGIECWSPMRGKQYLSNVGVISGAYEFDPMAKVKGIMARDFSDCCSCDLLLVNFLGSKVASIGTSMEVAWAYAKHTPTVAVVEDGNIHLNHPMIEEAISFVVGNHEDAINLIKSFFRV